MFVKKLLFTFLMTLYVIQIFPNSFVYAEEEVTDTLVIYDSIAYNSPYAGNIDDLKRLLSSFKLDYTVINADKYQLKDIQKYKNVIVVQNINELSHFNELLEQDLQSYGGRYLHIGYNPPKVLLEQLNMTINTIRADVVNFSAMHFDVKSINLNDINLIESNDAKNTTYGELSLNTEQQTYPLGLKRNNMSYLSFYLNEETTSLFSSYLIRDWLEVADIGNIYVMIDEVYPFSDLDHLKELAEKMYNAGIPFIVSVNPIFSNLDYPASKLYLETLKQIQYFNGTIIVDAPNVTNTLSADRTIIHSKMELFLDWLMENGVAPLGTSAQLHWFFDHYYTDEGLLFYDSIIMMPNENIIHYQPKNYTQKYNSSLYMISYSNWKSFISDSVPISNFPMNVAITFNYIDDGEQIESYITQLSQSWISIEDYKKAEHLVKTDKFTSSSSKGLLAINGEILSKNNNSKAVETEYEYYMKNTATFEKQFQFQNKFFIVVIIIVLIIFTLFLFNGYKLYKKKYVDKGM